ncbi:MAG: glycosyltransferase family 39 protein [Planctomycetota bacterium]
MSSAAQDVPAAVDAVDAPGTDSSVWRNSPEDRFGAFRSFHVRILFALTAVGAAIRLFRLGEWSFWVDEAHTFRDATSPITQFWASNVSNYPLGYLLVRELMERNWLPNTTEAWLRLPFTFFGILAIPMLAILGRAIVGRRAAILAAGFLAISPWHVYWSQNSRGYAPELLFAMLGVFALHRMSGRQPVLYGALALCSIAIAGAWHPSGLAGIFIAVSYVGAELWTQPELRRKLFSPPAVLVGALLVGGLAYWLVPTIQVAIENKPEFSPVHLVQTFTWFLRPEFLAAALAGWLLMSLRAERRSVTLLACWIAAPVLVLIGLGSTVMKVTAQYGLIILPAVLLLSARLIVDVADAVREQGRIPRLLRWSLPFILLSSLGAELFLYFFARSGDRPRWREAASYVLEHRRGPIHVITSNTPSLEYYLDRNRFFPFRSEDPEIEIEGFLRQKFRDAGGGREFLLQRRQESAAAERELWVILTPPELSEWDRDGRFDEAVREFGHQLLRLPAWAGPKDMTVLVYRVPSPR